MTHRCRLALDEATVDAMTADGSDKAAAWEALLRGYEGVREEVEGAGGEGDFGAIEFDAGLDTEDFVEEEARRERVAANHPCAKGGRDYGMRGATISWGRSRQRRRFRRGGGGWRSCWGGRFLRRRGSWLSGCGMRCRCWGFTRSRSG